MATDYGVVERAVEQAMTDSMGSVGAKDETLKFLASLREQGFEVVKVLDELAPRTVYIGSACDHYETTYRQGGKPKRVLVVEMFDVERPDNGSSSEGSDTASDGQG